ncbi:MAG: hypothetical protein U0R81_07385 [Mycobacterium sp.]
MRATAKLVARRQRKTSKGLQPGGPEQAKRPDLLICRRIIPCGDLASSGRAVVIPSSARSPIRLLSWRCRAAKDSATEERDA